MQLTGRPIREQLRIPLGVELQVSLALQFLLRVSVIVDTQSEVRLLRSDWPLAPDALMAL